jgi:hypothetical protein
MWSHHYGVWKVDGGEAEERKYCSKHRAALLDVK